jgi:redox-sensitive bicupin YhaK (pirin superfamily)
LTARPLDGVADWRRGSYRIAMSLKVVAAAGQIAVVNHSPSFSTRSIRDLGVSVDPFLTADLFHMSQPTFPPHPHAGFSAVTYMLPESPGAFVNRDSQGDTSRIGPGDLHVTEAASGMMHEEIPETPGLDCLGFQIFVKLPRALELGSPHAKHVDSGQMPVVKAAGSTIRVVAGAYQSQRSPVVVSYPFSLLDVTVEPGHRLLLELPASDRAWGVVVSGSGRSGSVELTPLHAVAWREGAANIEVSASDTILRLMLGSSAPIGEPVQSRGPFAMSDDARLEDARRRFGRGEMGTLLPSF